MTSCQEENNEEENKDATHQSKMEFKKEAIIRKDEPRQEENKKEKKGNESNIKLPPRKNPRGKLVTKNDAPVTQEGCTAHNEEQKPNGKEKEAQADSVEEPKGEEVTQGPTKEKVNWERKLITIPSILEERETRASKKQETKQSVSRKGQIVKQRKRKWMIPKTKR